MRNSSNTRNQQSDETFRFDSTMIKPKKQSIPKSISPYCHPNKSRPPDSKQHGLSFDFSQRTSQVVRYIDENNSNILELLEESENNRTANKVDDGQHRQLWEFFQRFQKETNPSVSLTELNLSRNKDKSKSRVQKRKKSAKNKQFTSIYKNETQQDQTQRYPRRNRIRPLRYWMNERPVYKNGQLVGIIAIEEKQSSQN